MHELLAGLAGLTGSLIMGKLKKSATPVLTGGGKWGPSNNAIPVTNPIITGYATWEATSEVSTTATAVAGSLAAWGIHRLWKKYVDKK